MKSLMLLVCGWIVYFGSISAAWAASVSRCPEQAVRTGQIQVQVNVGSSGDCMISVTPLEVSGLVYRSYLFASDGTFMIFNSFGEGPESTTTGARVFYLFPSGGELGFQVLSGGDVRVQTPSGQSVVFSSSNARIQEITESDFVEDPRILLENEGGVEIQRFPGLLLDLGFKLGNDPRSSSKRTSEFKDTSGNRCKVLNEEIFEYRPQDPGWDIPLRFKSDQEWSAFFRTRCPGLTP